jgi:ArsR family transcriptional regulator, virulence genes transcriptional regulator
MDAIARSPKSGVKRGTKSATKATTGKERRGRGRSNIDKLAEQAAAAARMLKLLGNEYRLLILCFLIAQGEMKVGDLVDAVGLSQSALSQHLALLRVDGLVAFRRESQTLYYSVADPRAAQILKLLKYIYCGDLA